MKGDFSRLRFGNPTEHPQILMQQGRVLLDSDWNAQTTALARATAQFQRDLIGPAGGPVRDLGFAITGAAGLDFNTTTPHQRQSLHLKPAPNLPFQSSAPVSDEGDLVLPIPDDIPAGVLHYTIELQIALKPGAAGTILCRPGHAILSVRADDHLVLSCWDTSLPIELVSPLPVSRQRMLTIFYIATPTCRLILVDGVPVIEAPPEVRHGQRPAGEPVLVAAAAWATEEQSPQHFLSCRLDGLRIWRRALDGRALYRSLAQDCDGPSRLLVCDLDFGHIEEGKVSDRSHNKNVGRLLPVDSRWQPFIVSLRIGAGQYFVNGAAVANPAPVRFGHQPWLPHGQRVGGFDRLGRHLVYLDVWRRFVTALEAPELRDVALGGPDTTGRAQPVWQARLIVARDAEDRAVQWERLVDARERPGQLAMRRNQPAGSMIGNDLYRVEIANPGWALDRDWTPDHPWAPVPMSVAELAAPLELIDDRLSIQDALVLGSLDVGATAVLLVGFGADWIGRRVTVTRIDPDGAIAIDRDLATVEQEARAGHGHTAEMGELALAGIRLLPLATFRFSPSNGSDANAVTAIAASSPGDGIASLLVPDPAGLAFRPGDWVELSNRNFDLNRRSGPMFQIGSIDANLAQVELLGWQPGPEVPAAGPKEHALLRRWGVAAADTARMDLQADDTTAPVYPVVPGRWIALSDGVEIRFGGAGWYGRGAYWTAATRAGGQPTLEWPGSADAPASLPPEGPEIGLAPLADLDMTRAGMEITDHRLRFAELSSHEPPMSPALSAALLGFADAFGDWAETERPWPSPSPRDTLIGLLKFSLDKLLDSEVKLIGSGRSGDLGLNRSGLTIAAGTLATARWQHNPTPVELAGAAVAVRSGPFVRVISEKGAVWRLDPEALAEPEIPATAWRLEAVLPQHRRHVIAAGLGDLVYVIGGSPTEEVVGMNRVDVLYPDGGWDSGPLLSEGIEGAAAAACGSAVYVCGGRSEPDRRAGTSLLRLAHGGVRWETVAPMPTARRDLALSVHDGCLYAIGGRGDDGRPLGAVERYNPVSDSWMSLAPLLVPSFGLSAGAIATGPVVVGGYVSQGQLCQDVAAYYEAEFDRWRLLATIGQPRARGGLVCTGGTDAQILMIGGLGDGDQPLRGLERLHTVRHLPLIG